MNRGNVKDYASAERWLSQRRNKQKTYRTLYDPSQSLYLYQRGNDAIAVYARWYQQDIITYYKDGSIILNLSGYAKGSQFVRRIIGEYSPAKVVKRNFKLVIHTAFDGLTPSKIQKCRSCSGLGTKPKYCYGPGYSCTDDSCEQTALGNKLYKERTEYLEKKYGPAWYTKSDEYADALWEQYRETKHTHPLCQHKPSKAHKILNDRDPCWGCNSTGKKEYGNKQRGRVWSGDPITIDGNGNYYDDNGNQIQ